MAVLEKKIEWLFGFCAFLLVRCCKQNIVPSCCLKSRVSIVDLQKFKYVLKGVMVYKEAYSWASLVTKQLFLSFKSTPLDSVLQCRGWDSANHTYLLLSSSLEGSANRILVENASLEELLGIVSIQFASCSPVVVFPH